MTTTIPARPGRYDVPLAAESSHSARRAVLDVTIRRDGRALRDLAGDWDGLLDHATSTSAFLRYGWMSSWWDEIGSRSRSRTPFVVTARDRDGRLVGVLPLYRDSHGVGPLGWRVLRLLGTGQQAPEHLDAIVDRDDDGQVLEALLGGLTDARAEFDALELTDLADGGVLAGSLASWAASNRFRLRRREAERCPYIRLAGAYEPYFASLAANHRRKVRVCGQRLEAQYRVELTVASDPASVRDALEELFRLHALRWRAKRRLSAFDRPDRWAFHRRVAAAMATTDGIRVFLLRCDGRAVAAGYCLRSAGGLYFYQQGFDPAFAALQVGKVLLGRILAYAFANDIVEFDFLRGEERYKFDWANGVRSTLDCDVSVSRRGLAWLLAKAAARRTRSAAVGTAARLGIRRRG